MNRLFTLFLSGVLLFLSICSEPIFAQSPVCAAAVEFCAENGLSFPAGVNTGSAAAGNNYGCLATQPNPAWFYMSSTAAGTATITLTSTPAQDIDFAVWGPFTSLADALSNCGSLGAPISCSYAPATVETAVINSGGPGEFFIMLVTNFSNQPTDISGSSSSTILGCNVCIAEGGELIPGDQVGCLSTLEDIEVDFQGATPDPATFGYTLLVTDPAGNVTSEYPFQTTLSPSLLGPGTFRICGVAYELGSGEPASFVGQNVGTLGADLSGPNPPFCGDVSDNCVDITIALDPIPSFLTDSVCIGAEEPNCPFINGEYICDPGAGSFTVQNALGCDSLVNYLILPRSVVITTDSLRLCPGEEFVYDGTTYFAPNVVPVTVPAVGGAGCDTTVFLTLQLDPLLAVVTPPIFNLDCNTTSVVLSSAGSSTGPTVSYEWEGPSGPLGSLPDITVSQAGSYSLTVTRINPNTGQSCSTTATAIITSDPIDVGGPVLTGDQQLCVNESGQFDAIYTGANGPYTYDWILNGGGESIVSQTAGNLVVSWSTPGAKEVCVAATGTCGATDTTCFAILVEDIAIAVSSGDETFCDLQGAVSATPTGGSWSQVGVGPGTATITNPNSASTAISVTAAGDYTFEYTPAGNCVESATAVLTFSDPFTIAQTTETCQATALEYIVEVELVGGTPPFMFTGNPGVITGSTFTSTPIVSGDTYLIVFTDANGCTTQVTGSTNCACTTDAGQMPSQLVSACTPDQLQADAVFGATLDGNDVGQYVLHDANGITLGTVFAQNTTGLFDFLPPLQANIQYYVSYVVGNDDGQGNPDPADPCYSVAAGQPVRWIQPETADAGTDISTCDRRVNMMAGNQAGSWTVPAGLTISDVNDPFAEVASTTAGSYTLAWTTGASGCTDEDQVDVTFWEIPTATFIEDCDATGTSVTVTITVTGGVGPYVINGSLTATGAGNVFTATVPAGSAYDFRVEDANCQSILYQSTPDCDCLTDAGSMSPTLVEVCTNQVLSVGPPSGANLDPDDSGSYVLHTTATYAPGDEIFANGTGQFALLTPLTPNTTYYVSYIAGNDVGGQPDPSDPCFDISASATPIQWVEAPQAFAGLDDTTCGLTYNLSASGTPGNWIVPAGVTLSSAVSPSAMMTVPAPGTYAVFWETNRSGCTDRDTVAITFADSPQVSAVENCDAGDAEYAVFISIAGGLAPYTINGLPTVGAGNSFSAMVASGSSYSFTVTDANGCISGVISGSRDCDCGTEAPQLVSGRVLCMGEPLSLQTPTGGVNDGDDIDNYVLYSGTPTQVSMVLARATTPDFAYDPTYLAGVTYYVAVERGNNLSGSVDQSDPCLDRSTGVPVRWEPLPQLDLTDATACEGDIARVNYSYTGNLPATFEFTIDGQPRAVTLTDPNGAIDISGAGGVLQSVSLRENSGCQNDTLSAFATVTFQTNDPPELAQNFSLCNSAASGDPTSVVLATLLVNGGAGTWTSPDAPGAINAGEFEAAGLAPGNYQLTYTTIASGSCPSTSASLTVTVRDCACPNLTLLNPGLLCNGDATTIDLNDLLEDPQVGDWSFGSTPSGSNPAGLAGAIFDGFAADPGQYELIFTLTQGIINGCPESNSIFIELIDNPDAGTAQGVLEFCEGESNVFDLNTALSGQDLGGNWSAVNVPGAALSGANLNVGSLQVGTYDFTYEVSATPPCQPASSTVRVVINPVPRADAGAAAELTCIDREVEIGTAGVAGLVYEWTASGATGVLGTSAVLRTDVSGSYTLTVTDPNSGCSATDSVLVTSSDDVPIVEIEVQPISCFQENDAAVAITSISGGEAPYSISFNGSLVGSQRVFSSLGPGTVQLEVVDGNGCTADPLVFEITQPEDLSVSIDLFTPGSGAGEIQFLDTVFLEAKIAGDSSTTVAWSPAEYVACDTCAVTYGIPPASLTYTVEVQTSEGCRAQDVIQVIVRNQREVYFPTAFSPNGDNVNDYFFPQAREGLVRRINYLRIYDRWGELLFVTVAPPINVHTAGWNGTFSGKLLNPQVVVYVCEVEFADGSTEVFKGDLSLVR